MSAAPLWRTETRLSHLARRVEALPLEKRALGRALLGALKRATRLMLAQAAVLALLCAAVCVAEQRALLAHPGPLLALPGLLLLGYAFVALHRRDAWACVHAPDAADPRGSLLRVEAWVWRECETDLLWARRRLAQELLLSAALLALLALGHVHSAALLVYLPALVLPSALRAQFSQRWGMLRHLLALVRGTGLPGRSAGRAPRPVQNLGPGVTLEAVNAEITLSCANSG